MLLKRFSGVVAASLLAVQLAAPSTARAADDYPERGPMTFLVGSGSGGGADDVVPLKKSPIAY